MYKFKQNLFGGETIKKIMLIIALICFLGTSIAHAEVVNLNNNKTFTSIQSAIDDYDTKDGHIIFVKPGEYCENIVINKSITLEGDGKAKIIAKDPSIPTIYINTDNITIEGFIINTNGIYAIMALNASNCVIRNNIIYTSAEEPGSGICINGTTRDWKIENNTIIGGIFTYGFSKNYKIIGNNIMKCKYAGIHLGTLGGSTDSCEISENIIRSCKCGIALDCANNCIIQKMLFSYVASMVYISVQQEGQETVLFLIII